MNIKELLTELTFYGRTCTKDCSGHNAGHAWAQQHKVANAADCASGSPSFTGGCQVAAQQATMAQQKKTQVKPKQYRAATGRYQSKASAQGTASMANMAQQLGQPKTV